MTARKLMALVRTAIFTLGVLTAAPRAHAQETVNYASVSGRVMDASGAIDSRARSVTARQIDTNVTATGGDGSESGASGFRYLKSGRMRSRSDQPGIRRRLATADAPTVGAAFELPFSLTVAGVAADVTVNAGNRSCSKRRAARSPATISQAEGQGPAAQRPQLPGPGAARARRLSRRINGSNATASPRRPPSPASASRSAASAISPTTSSWTASRRTTMRPG